MSRFQIKTIVTYSKDAWIICGIILLLFLSIEFLFSLFFYVKDNFGKSDLTVQDPRSQFIGYDENSWVNDYFKEFNESFVSHWEPYLYWRRNEYCGKYINISPEGIRFTKISDYFSDKERPKLRIFIFGGSTVWGTGARDLFTIPSLLVKELDKMGIRSEVTNFGESGYVSTQEVILLLLQLQKGNIPNIAIFLDGVNDTFSAYQNKVPGVPQNEINRVEEFNLMKKEKLKDLKSKVFKQIINDLSLSRFINSFLKKFQTTRKSNSPDDGQGESVIKKSSNWFLARKVISLYLTNIEIVRTLASAYDFKSFFYWQPTIFQKNSLSDYERDEFKKKQYLEGFFGIISTILSEKQEQGFFVNKHFRDFSFVFSSIKHPVFIDWCHLSEMGNAIIAQELVEDILPFIHMRNIPVGVYSK